MDGEIRRYCLEHHQLVTVMGLACSWAILADALHASNGLPVQYARRCQIVDRLLVEVPVKAEA